jgi:glucose-6-phosphate 1-dehydrogenase
MDQEKQSTTIVIFGASGDLTHRKLIPALSNIYKDGFLGSDFNIIGCARTKFDDVAFRETLRPASDLDSWEAFSKNIYYQALDVNQAGDFEKLKARINALNPSGKGTFLYYLSTSPEFFTSVADNLREVGLVETDPSAPRQTRLVVEKPFGFDVKTSQELNTRLRKTFREDQIYRIDHYLGKETVQNILVMRFCNHIFEPLWNARYVEQIQISVCEDIGVGSRAGYFDKTGITRDVIQNHVMQVLSLLCIEPPLGLRDADSIRDEKVKVLRSIKRYSPLEALANSVRAQYSKGTIGGQEARGYIEEKGVDASSSTETFVAMKLEIDNWRWAGVPIFIRAGKRLPKRITEISVWFKTVPTSLLRKSSNLTIGQNVLTIQVQPREGISLSMNSKLPGQSLRVSPVELDFSYAHSFEERSPEAYERLLLDAIKGESTLFTRDDEIEEAWDVLAPFFEAWQSGLSQLPKYEAGTWGPEESNTLLGQKGYRWRRLD